VRVTLKRDVLLETLGKVKSAAPRNPSLPILASILVTAKGGLLTLAANDLEVCVLASCKANISKAGSIAVSPVMLEDFLKRVSGTTVTLSAKTATLTVEAGAASTTMKGFAPEDFPKLPKLQGKPVVIYGLDKAVGEVLYAVAREEHRPVLCGVSLTPKNGRVELAAADGFRLAITSARVKGTLKEQLIVPAKALSLLKRFLPGNVTALVWGKDDRDKAIAFHQNNGVTVVAKTIAGNYPNYAQLIPKKGSLLKVATDQLKQALETVMAIKPENDAVKLQGRGKSLVVSARDGADRVAAVKVPATGKVKAGFNGKYLKDLLGVVGKDFMLRMEKPETPGVVKNNGTVHVLMPMNVQW